MKKSTTSKNKNPKKSNQPIDQIKNSDFTPVDLFDNADFLRLNEHYQNADFVRSKEMVDKLEEQYPEHPELIYFKNELDLKISLKTIADSNNKEEKRKKKKATMRLAAFAIFGTLVVLTAFFISYIFLNKNASSQRLEEKLLLITTLDHQTEQLLLIGQPQPAAEIIEKMRSIDPDYENLADLSFRTEKLLQLEARYQEALSIINEGNHDNALVILQEIDAEKPGLWAVSQQIAAIENINQIAILIEEGHAAFLANNWNEAINAYESALKFDPKLEHPLMTEQLIKSYLYKSISLLQNENSTLEDVVIAEQCYRKAIVLISQNKSLASVMKNLQEENSNLLFVKFVQSATAILEDKNQSVTTISKAVSFLRKAVVINPTDTELQTNLNNAAYYQIGFHSFINMNWNSAINNFNQVVSEDVGFVSDNINILRYEAYTALGAQSYSEGRYQDALDAFKQTETYAQSARDNLMRLFQVQVLLGDTVGEMGDYETAVAYYQSAMNAIQVGPKLSNHPAIAIKYEEANNLAANEDFPNAFAAFQDVLRDISIVYSIVEIEANEGVNLALFAHEYGSTLDAIFEVNQLPDNLIITMRQTIKVPMIEN